MLWLDPNGYPCNLVMLKFKVSETDGVHGFKNDLIAISSSKTTNNIIDDEYNERICENQVDTFINLCKTSQLRVPRLLNHFFQPIPFGIYSS